MMLSRVIVFAPHQTVTERTQDEARTSVMAAPATIRSSWVKPSTPTSYAVVASFVSISAAPGCGRPNCCGG